MIKGFSKRYLFTGLMFFLFVSLAKAENGQTDSFKNEFDSDVRIIPDRSVKGESGHISIFENETNYTHKVEFLKKLPFEASDFRISNRYFAIYQPNEKWT